MLSALLALLLSSTPVQHTPTPSTPVKCVTNWVNGGCGVVTNQDNTSSGAAQKPSAPKVKVTPPPPPPPPPPPKDDDEGDDDGEHNDN